MLRSSGLALAVLFGAVWLMAYGQGGGYPPRDGPANGAIYWTNEIDPKLPSLTTNNQNGTVNGSGIYLNDLNTTPKSITMFLMLVGGGETYKATTTAKSNSWTATKGSLPPGNYEVWLVYELEMGTEIQAITAPVLTTTVANATMPPPQHNTFGNSIGLAANSPSRNQAKTQMNGNGQYSTGGGWTLTKAPPPPVQMWAFPVRGGRVLFDADGATTAGAANPYTWNATIEGLQANVNYNVITTLATEVKADTKSISIGSAWLKNK